MKWRSQYSEGLKQKTNIFNPSRLQPEKDAVYLGQTRGEESSCDFFNVFGSANSKNPNTFVLGKFGRGRAIRMGGNAR